MAKTTLTEGTYQLTGDDKIVATLPFYMQVGRALSMWAITESQLSEYYSMLVCGKNTPVDGAITTFYELRSFDERKSLISKCLDQVLYPNEFNDFRKDAKKKLNRIQTLSQVRNKIAHGAVLEYEKEAEVAFYPYFMDAISHRQRGLEKIHGSHPSTVKKPIKWNLEDLSKYTDSLDEALTIATDLAPALAAQYEENSELLKDTTRMLLRPGLPFRSRPKDQK